MSNRPEWMKWKYYLGDNDILCDGKVIASADTKFFDLPTEEFRVAVQEEGLRLGWLVKRANAMPELLEALKQVDTWLAAQGPQGDFIRDAIARAEGRT
jgi:hypothetical protein